MKPRQGEVWWTAFDPVRGSEIAKTRPALVVSVDQINSAPLDVAIVVPITTTPVRLGVAIELPQDPQGPRRISYVLPHQIRLVSHERLTSKIGMAGLEVRQEVAKRIAVLTRVRD